MTGGHFFGHPPQVIDFMGGHFFSGHSHCPLSGFHIVRACKLLIRRFADTFGSVRFYCPFSPAADTAPPLGAVRPTVRRAPPKAKAKEARLRHLYARAYWALTWPASKVEIWRSTRAAWGFSGKGNES